MCSLLPLGHAARPPAWRAEAARQAPGWQAIRPKPRGCAATPSGSATATGGGEKCGPVVVEGLEKVHGAVGAWRAVEQSGDRPRNRAGSGSPRPAPQRIERDLDRDGELQALALGRIGCAYQGLDRVRRPGCVAHGRGDSTDRGERRDRDPACDAQRPASGTAPGALVYKERAPKRMMCGRPSFSLVKSRAQSAP
jgi:hypothetical protein